MSGQLNLVSEFLPDLPPERLDIYKCTLPNTGHSGKPVDLFEREMPRTWHMTWGEGDDRRDVVALLNWPAPPTQPSNTKKTAGMEEPTADKGNKKDGNAKIVEGPMVTLDPAQLGLTS